MTSIERELRRFIAQDLLLGRPFDLAPSTSLLDAGVIDSTGVLELVQFIEERWGIELQDDEIIPANLDSLDGLVRFVHEKSAARQ